MDVFLIPLGPIETDAYELYCEPPASPAQDVRPPAASWRSRVASWFRGVLAEGESARTLEAAGTAERSWLRRTVTARIAEAVAEQRLLWHLRHETHATLVHPDDLPGERAVARARVHLSYDLVRHRRWCVIDTLLAIASVPVALLPGPNLIGYYFVFRAVGHLLSMRGARHGLQGVRWDPRPTPLLTTLRQAAAREDPDPARTIQSVADGLGLMRLAAFVQKMIARRQND